MGASDLTVVIADPFRLRAIRYMPPFTGRVLYFSDSNLGSAFESIRAHHPRVIALESNFAHTSQGRDLVDRVQRLPLSESAVQILSLTNGEWSARLPSHAAAAAIAPASVIATSAAAVAASVNTRRVPRFPVLDPLAMKVDGLRMDLVDMSVMGAQVLSAPVLRPNQRLKVTLPDEENSCLSVSAYVAWSAFELPKNALQPYYRAGVEFTDAAVQALEAFCKRHCANEPVALRR
jgi:hypothetical protein